MNDPAIQYLYVQNAIFRTMNSSLVCRRQDRRIGIENPPETNNNEQWNKNSCFGYMDMDYTTQFFPDCN